MFTQCDGSCAFLSGESVTAETAASILTKVYSTIKISKYTPGAMSDVYDFLV